MKKKNTMAIAWDIRKATAQRLNCEVMDVDMRTCLKMAHHGIPAGDIAAKNTLIRRDEIISKSIILIGLTIAFILICTSFMYCLQHYYLFSGILALIGAIAVIMGTVHLSEYIGDRHFWLVKI